MTQAVLRIDQSDRPRQRFLGERDSRLLIGGEWVPAVAGITSRAIDPTTEGVLARIAAADSEDVDRAVKAARAAFESTAWSTMNPHERTRLLLRIADAIEGNREEFAELEALDIGAPYETGLNLAVEAANIFRYYAGWPTKILGETYPSGPTEFRYTIREPIGVCGAIIPWNPTLLMSAWKLAPAMACGNTVILKPAEQAPLSVLRLGELVMESDVPPGVVNILTGTGESAGAAIVEHPGIDKIAFTGSTEVGKQILRESAATLKRVTLELGGKAPNIIFADCEFDTAAVMASVLVCTFTGQVCVSGSRVLVQDEIYDEFVERLATEMAAYTIGDPFHPETRMGPLVSKEQHERVNAYLEVGRREGAGVRLGGYPLEGTGYFVSPTLFSDVSNSMRIASEEIFGPVASVIRFTDIEDAISIGNDTKYGLSASVWTRDITKAHRVARAARAGTIYVNTWSANDGVVPLGGYKQSGVGYEHGPRSVDSYTELKTVAIGQ